MAAWPRLRRSRGRLDRVVEGEGAAARRTQEGVVLVSPHRLVLLAVGFSAALAMIVLAMVLATISARAHDQYHD